MLVALLTGLLGSAALAADEADWPCVQRLQPRLAPGQLWQGAPLEDLPKEAQLDPALGPLAPALASNDLALEAVPARLDAAMAGIRPEERAVQAALLFTATLEAVNAERGRVIDGIKRFARNQHRLADTVTEEGRRLAALGGSAEAQDLSAQRAWNMRLFDDRQRTIRVLCDQPVRLEQRAFALARLLAGRS